MADRSHDSQTSLIIGISAFLTILAIAAVSLRFLSRKLSQSYLWWDDWAVLAALPWVLGYNICSFYAVHTGLGRHAADLPPDATVKYLQIAYFAEIVYVPAIGFIKFSILFFYRRIFPQRSVRIIGYVVGAVVGAWTIAITFAFIFQCTPIHKAWDFTTPGHCVVVKKVWLGNAIPNIITDIVILITPLPLVWALQITRSQKFAVCGIFLTGGFVCIVSIIRLTVLLRTVPTDFTWNYASLQIWSAVEPSIGLVCACLPSMRYLLKRLTSPWSHSKTARRRDYAAPISLSKTTPKLRIQERDSLEDGLTTGKSRS